MDVKNSKKKSEFVRLSDLKEFSFFKYSIEHPAKDSLSTDEKKFGNACRILGSMVNEKRTDAGIFLLGLIVYYKKKDIKRLEVIVENLKYFENTVCSDFLFEEIINTESNNKNRIYINTIIDILSRFKPEMVIDRFYEFSIDKRFSYKMRNKFLCVIENLENRDW